MTYNGNTYYYVLNLQGDVMALLDANGNEVVSYHYNAWGKLLSYTASTETMRLTLALYNPLRHRGYVYDRETGLYYLQSRYYNPELGRFINVDKIISTNQGIVSYSLFTYCGNNPVCRIDPRGNLWIWNVVKTTGEAVIDTAYLLNGGYISDQSAPGIGNRDLGIATVSHGGCGAVASYNALISLGEKISFSNVVDYFNQRSRKRLLLGGLLGMMPSSVRDFFTDMGYSVVITGDPDEIETYSQTADASILWYLFPQDYLGLELFGAHFVEYHRTPDGYAAYNTSQGVNSFSTVSEYMGRGNRYGGIGIFIFE